MTKRQAIFISYRREESGGHAWRLHDRLSGYFESQQIFIDADSIEPGLDFVEAIENAVGSCDVLLAVIGKNWLGAADSLGRRRLDNPEDFVRLEVAAALERNIRIIPVLVNGAAMPLSTELPPALAKFARRNAIELSDHRWHFDTERLIKTIESVLAATDGKTVRSERNAARPTAQTSARPDSTLGHHETNVAPHADRHSPLDTDEEEGRDGGGLDDALFDDLPEDPNELQRYEEDAARFARLLVSEIKLYNEQKVRDGFERADLYGRLRGEIDSARRMYDKRAHPSVLLIYDYFHRELIATLAQGDIKRMGPDYPGEKTSK